MEYLKQYWPVLAIAFWLLYRWWNSSRVLAMLPTLKAEGAVFVDVRSPEEFASGHCPGTLNVPLAELSGRLSEISKTSPVVLCCASGTRSGMAGVLLKKAGYPRVYNVGTWSKLLGKA